METLGVEITGEMMSDIFEVFSGVFSDLNPLILLIIGVVFSLFIFEIMIRLIESKMKHRREEAELRQEALKEIISPYKRHVRKERKAEIRRELVHEA